MPVGRLVCRLLSCSVVTVAGLAEGLVDWLAAWFCWLADCVARCLVVHENRLIDELIDLIVD